MQQNFMDPSEDPLSLDRIRNVLIRLEDTIIFCIIERAQFALNPKIYLRGAFDALKDNGFTGSWLEWFLKEIESFHAKARRYTSPDEYPFTKNLPTPLLPALNFPKILHDHPACRDINLNSSILSFYTKTIVPRITYRATMKLAARKRAQGITGDDEFEDDGNYGSAATTDVELLHAISKRVHYGKFVSESKFMQHPEDFIPPIIKKDREALARLITKPAVERAVLSRLYKKAAQYGPDLGIDGEPIRKTPKSLLNDTLYSPKSVRMDTDGRVVDAAIPGSGILLSSPSHVPSPLGHTSTMSMASSLPDRGDEGEYEWKIDLEDVRHLYENWIIPLTKEVEVEYLIHRLDGLSQEEIDGLQNRGRKPTT